MKNGGPAFARPYFEHHHNGEYSPPQDGMSLRAHLAAHAPIGFNECVIAYGGVPNLSNDKERAAFFAVWTLLRAEYADAMIEELGVAE